MLAMPKHLSLLCGTKYHTGGTAQAIVTPGVTPWNFAGLALELSG
jgi:hypothetical protein